MQLTQQFTQHGERLLAAQQQQQMQPENAQLLALVQQGVVHHNGLKQQLLQTQEMIKQLQAQVNPLEILMQQQKEQEMQKQLQLQRQQQQQQQQMQQEVKPGIMDLVQQQNQQQ